MHYGARMEQARERVRPNVCFGWIADTDMHYVRFERVAWRALWPVVLKMHPAKSEPSSRE